MSTSWLTIERALEVSGMRADPAEVARVLAGAGVPVTRNSRAQWVVPPRHPGVRIWLTAMAAGTWALPEPEPEPSPGDWTLPGPEPGQEPSRRTGRHVFPDPPPPRAG